MNVFFYTLDWYSEEISLKRAIYKRIRNRYRGDTGKDDRYYSHRIGVTQLDN